MEEETVAASQRQDPTLTEITIPPAYYVLFTNFFLQCATEVLFFMKERHSKNKKPNTQKSVLVFWMFHGFAWLGDKRLCVNCSERNIQTDIMFTFHSIFALAYYVHFRFTYSPVQENCVLRMRQGGTKGP